MYKLNIMPAAIADQQEAAQYIADRLQNPVASANLLVLPDAGGESLSVCTLHGFHTGFSGIPKGNHQKICAAVQNRRGTENRPYYAAGLWSQQLRGKTLRLAFLENQSYHATN